MKIKKIALVIFSRANYASIKGILKELKKDKNLNFFLVVGSSAVIDKYGSILNILKNDGYKADYILQNQIEGTTTKSMVKTTGLALYELPEIFDKEKPDIVFTVGDRHETISTAIASTYMNIPLAHTMGGEVTGSIDESIRHSITKLAHYHFVSNKDSYERVLKLGEKKSNIFNVGCPRIDSVDKILRTYSPSKCFNEISNRGSGDLLSLSHNDDYIVLLYHPVTTEYEDNHNNFENVIQAFCNIKISKKVILWPNADAGADKISRIIRVKKEKKQLQNVKFFKNLPIELYIPLIHRAKCLIGNSSSAIRDGAYIGVRAVNIGNRQSGRLAGPNIIACSYSKKKIIDSINIQTKKKLASKSLIYGKPGVAKRIVRILKNIKSTKIQKQITY
ncbi:UDP-N-acetylglucosamine 2-epimerase (hydrolyzing) [Pelagibacterales bacterium SAG-MED08]|nr:UDP-N-acetylglucosamine 2-epimerase (hydrolyzing) [Pelagibacterales bacterium SAG-MED08]